MPRRGLSRLSSAVFALACSAVRASQPAWLDAMQADGFAAAARCASRQHDAPAVAFCITGAGRSFGAPLLQASLRHRVMQAYGGSAGSRVFLQLKTHDTQKVGLSTRVPGMIKFGQTQASRGQLLNASQGWLRPMIAEAVIVEGEGSVTRSSGNESSIQIVASNQSEWQEYRAACAIDDPYLAAGTNEKRLILHHLGLAWCDQAITRFEQRANSTFDQVMYLRPDALRFKAMRSWCETSNERVRIRHFIRPGVDMMWITPRKYMHAMMQQVEVHRTCNASIPQPRRRAHCCHTSEYLLWYTIDNGLEKNNSMPTNIPATTSDDLYPGDNSFDVLRHTLRTCELALSRSYPTYALRYQAEDGLPIRVGTYLRMLFGNNTVACKHALGT
ncbi:hypothetical protein AB1Y20_010917 [Prymnesium parvum]|uniref:Uncharacterized protein n=1 Tax=Prymnesium parvum TaxID=97485 RepID=A0AB34IQU4_PRYPA